MIITLAYAIMMFANILVTALCIRAIMSWFVRDMYSPIGKIYAALIRFTEPLIEPFRRILSRFNTGMFDFSLLFAVIAIEFISNFLVRLLFLIF